MACTNKTMMIGGWTIGNAEGDNNMTFYSFIALYLGDFLDSASGLG